MAERRPLVLIGSNPTELPDGDSLPTLSSETLTAARTYYVSPSGNDTNDGLSPASPFATIQKAVDVVCSLDLSIYQATIQLADGTYTSGATLKSYVGALPPIIQGNAATPANVVISTTANYAIGLDTNSSWIVINLKLTTISSGACLRVNAGKIEYSGIDFGTCATDHIQATEDGVVICTGAYTISGGATLHIVAGRNGVFRTFGGFTVTITGTPGFYVFAQAAQGGAIRYSSVTFIGSATGKRYDVSLNGTILTNGGTTFFPGSVAGTTATGGQYA